MGLRKLAEVERSARSDVLLSDPLSLEWVSESTPPQYYLPLMATDALDRAAMAPEAADRPRMFLGAIHNLCRAWVDDWWHRTGGPEFPDPEETSYIRAIHSTEEWNLTYRSVWHILCMRLRMMEPPSDPPGAWPMRRVDLGVARDVTPLLHFVADINAPVDDRLQACISLGLLEDASAVPDLQTVMLASAEPAIRAQAAWALGKIGDKRAARALRKVAINETELGDVRAHAIEALVDLRLRADLPRMVHLLADGDPQVRSAAAFALGEMGNHTHSRALESLLDDPAPGAFRQTVGQEAREAQESIKARQERRRKAKRNAEDQ